MLRGLGGILFKEVIQMFRDPAALVIMFAIPVLQLVIFGYAIDTEVRDVGTLVLDLDKTYASRDFVSRLTATGLYDVAGYVDSVDELRDAIVAGRAKVGVHLPAGYQRDINSGSRAQVQVFIDGSNNSVAAQTLGTVTNLGLSLNAELLGVRMDSPLMRIEVRPRLLFNPSLKSSNFFVPGIIGLLAFLMTMMLTAFAIVREREVGTLEQLMVTPVSRGALMFGKVLPYLLFGLLEMMIVVFAAQVIFGVRIEGSLYLLMGLAVIFVFSSLGLGLIISTFARTQMQAMLGSFAMMLPSVLLSGFMFPRESMPRIIYYISAALPLTYFMEILRGIILRGAAWDALWDEALVLLCMGITLLTVATLRFRKTVG